MTELLKVQETLTKAGVPLAQLHTLAPQVQKNASAIRAQDNVRKFSDFIGRSEGTVANHYGIADPYRVGFGGAEIKDLSAHPAASVKFNELNKDGSVGKVNSTTAAGKHQFIKPTWDALSKRTGVTDFSPQSQERNFVELLKDAKVLKAVEDGDFITAIDKLGNPGKKRAPIFASLPSSKANQPKNTPERIARMAKESGINLSSAVSGTNQPLSDAHIIDGLLPTQQQMAEKQQETQLADMQQQQLEAEMLAQNEQTQMEAAALQEQQMLAEEKQSKIDSIGAMLYAGTLGSVGKKPNISTKYDKQLMDLIDAA